MTPPLPGWVKEACTLPLGFAQVREDPALDRYVLDRIGRGARVVMVASGGCTAAALAAVPGAAAIHLVDPNLAQIALSRLKLQLLLTASTEERLALLGHVPMARREREAALAAALEALGLPAEALGPLDFVATLGPDQAGRYERVFVALREALGEWTAAVEGLLTLADPAEQARRVDSGTSLGAGLDSALNTTLALPNLVALFGGEATRNPREPFATHFARRLRWVLATQPARGNPFLSQMLLGRFAPGAEHAWLQALRPAARPEVTWAVTPMVEALRRRRADTDFVHLSNILDWLAPEAARETLDLARTALDEGGWVLIRQLNSTLDIPALGEGFEWRVDEGEALLARDRSFFYRAIHLGRRR